MSDLIEDQKIHYIVKDYRRMYNGYWTLKSMIADLQKSLEEKDIELLFLRSTVEKLKNAPKESPASQLPKEIKQLLFESDSQIQATINNLEKRIVTLTKTDENLKRVCDLIYSQ